MIMKYIFNSLEFCIVWDLKPAVPGAYFCIAMETFEGPYEVPGTESESSTYRYKASALTSLLTL